MLESLYPFEYVEKRHLHALLLGICYSLIALGVSVIIFPSDPSLISIAIITLLLYPTIQKLLLEHEKKEADRFHKGIFSFFSEHKNLLLFYLIICISIFAVFFAFSFINPSTTGVLFTQQDRVVSAMTGSAIGQTGQTLGLATATQSFLHYIQHNTKVLFLMFIAAFILGEGGILLLSWNASSWGVYFGASLSGAFGASTKAWSVLAAVAPHIILEFCAYIVIVITASIISKAIFSVHIPHYKKTHVFVDSGKAVIVAFMFLIIAAIVEVAAFSFVFNTLL